MAKSDHVDASNNSFWQAPERPVWLERLNAHGVAAGDAAAIVSLDPEDLIACAKSTTGLQDFGGGDWRCHFDVLVRALEAESSLHLMGRILVRTEILRSLRNRLLLTDLWSRQPKIKEVELSPVTFVVGSPRSGTSILHELLALDPAARAPAMWEMLHPVEALEGEEFRGVGDHETRFWHDLQPEYETMHVNGGDLPNECIFIAMNEFLSDQWGGCHVVPSYEVHLISADHRPAYRFHSDVLRVLQQRSGGKRWLLKAPSHLSQLRALFAVYPNARIIQTHRDPLKTIPSTLSLLGTLKRMRCERVDIVGLAPLIVEGQALAHERAIADRDACTIPGDQFVDVRYADLMVDPLGTIERLYEALGWSFSEVLAGRIATYLSKKPKGSRGSHKYGLEQMGLNASNVAERYRAYCTRFDIPAE